MENIRSNWWRPQLGSTVILIASFAMMFVLQTYPVLSGSPSLDGVFGGFATLTILHGAAAIWNRAKTRRSVSKE